jgi:cytochrome c oxidase assembly factor CtaG
MHPLAAALLGPWEWRLEILAVLIPLGILYTLGWRRVRRQSLQRRLATWPRLAAYLGGLFILALSLLSPVGWLGGQLFFMHMIQHMLTMMVAAPLLWLGEPFPFMLWALPVGARCQVASLFTRNSRVRSLLTAVNRPGVAWLLFLTIYLGWHDSTAYDTALSIPWVHDLQHITFFLAAMLFWWPIIGSAPHLHRSFPGWAKVAYLVGAVPPNMLVGITIAFSSKMLYSYYTTVPRIWGFTALQDQQLAGAIMWIQGSEMLIMVALVILFRMFRDKGSADPLTEWSGTAWDEADETTIAPGLEHRVTQHRMQRAPVERLTARTTAEATTTQPDHTHMGAAA